MQRQPCSFPCSNSWKSLPMSLPFGSFPHHGVTTEGHSHTLFDSYVDFGRRSADDAQRDLEKNASRERKLGDFAGSPIQMEIREILGHSHLTSAPPYYTELKNGETNARGLYFDDMTSKGQLEYHVVGGRILSRTSTKTSRQRSAMIEERYHDQTMVGAAPSFRPN